MNNSIARFSVSRQPDEVSDRDNQLERRRRDIEDIACADALSIYLTDIGEPGEQFEIEARIERLNEFWGGKKLSEVNAQTCAAYVRHRGNRGGARRDLETFRAAINHHAKEGFIGAWYACRFHLRARHVIAGSRRSSSADLASSAPSGEADDPFGDVER